MPELDLQDRERLEQLALKCRALEQENVQLRKEVARLKREIERMPVLTDQEAANLEAGRLGRKLAQEDAAARLAREIERARSNGAQSTSHPHDSSQHADSLRVDDVVIIGDRLAKLEAGLREQSERLGRVQGLLDRTTTRLLEIFKLPPETG